MPDYLNGKLCDCRYQNMLKRTAFSHNQHIQRGKTVRRVCNFLGSVLPQQKFEATDGAVLQLSFIWQAKENASLGHEGGQPNRHREESREEKKRVSMLAPLYMIFLLPLSLPWVNWASQEGCLLHQKFSFWSLDLTLFYFCGIFSFFVFQLPLFWTSFSYSNYLTRLTIFSLYKRSLHALHVSKEKEK